MERWQVWWSGDAATRSAALLRSLCLGSIGGPGVWPRLLFSVFSLGFNKVWILSLHFERGF